MVETFLSPEDDQRFKDWLAGHPRGYYLNEGNQGNIRRRAGGMILHRVGCHHLGDGSGMNPTSYGKAASDDLGTIRLWAEQAGLTVVSCRDCGPD